MVVCVCNLERDFTGELMKYFKLFKQEITFYLLSFDIFCLLLPLTIVFLINGSFLMANLLGTAVDKRG